MKALALMASALAGMVAIAGCSDEDDQNDVEETAGDGSDYGSFDGPQAIPPAAGVDVGAVADENQH